MRLAYIFEAEWNASKCDYFQRNSPAQQQLHVVTHLKHPLCACLFLGLSTFSRIFTQVSRQLLSNILQRLSRCQLDFFLLECTYIMLSIYWCHRRAASHRIQTIIARDGQWVWVWCTVSALVWWCLVASQNNHVAQSILATLLSLTGAGESPEWANELRPKGAKGVSKWTNES